MQTYHTAPGMATGVSDKADLKTKVSRTKRIITIKGPVIFKKPKRVMYHQTTELQNTGSRPTSSEDKPTPTT